MIRKNNYILGFIGAGRITRIFLHALEKDKSNISINVFDKDTGKTENLISQYSFAKNVAYLEELAQQSDIIFLAIHPPAFVNTLEGIQKHLNKEKLLISLAPKVTIEKIQLTLEQKIPVIRIIPNAPSYIGKGYNVYSKSAEVNNEIEELFKSILSPLGSLNQVKEQLLESFATITGMGPTFVWFLFYEFYQKAIEFGLSDEQAKHAVNEMLTGASETLFHSDLSYEQVLDLIPAYPFKEKEEGIKDLYGKAISELYYKLKI